MKRLVARFSPLARLGAAPCARSSHGVSAVNGRLYVIGGEKTARTPIDTTVHYLPLAEGGEWKAIPHAESSPPARIAHAQASVGNDIMLFGGRAGVQMGEAALNDLWSFDTVSEAWRKVEAASGETPCARSFHTATAVGERMYVFGGCGEAGRLADLHVFDVPTAAWRRLADPPGVDGRGGATLEASCDGRSLWLIGGFAGHETNDILRYDVASETWTRVPSGWLRPRSVSSSFCLGQSVFLFGGEVEPSDAGHEGAGGFADDLISLDAATGEPLPVVTLSAAPDGQAPSMPLARGWAKATAVAPGQAVLFGGLTGDDVNPVRLDDAWLISI